MSERLDRPTELAKNPSKDNSIILFLSSIVHGIKYIFSEIVKGFRLGWRNAMNKNHRIRPPQPSSTTV